MATGTISRRSVEALQPEAKEFVFWDVSLKGFGVRISPAGKKSYIFQYRPPQAKQKRTVAPKKVTLGHAGAMTPEQARSRAKSLAISVAQGIDPVEAEKEEALQLARERERLEQANLEAMTRTLDALKDDFLDHVEANSAASHQFCEGTLRLHILPVIGSVRIEEITKTDINRVLNRIEARKTALRRNVFAVLRWMATWAVDALDLRTNPMSGLKPPPMAAARDRFLSDDELRWIWKAAETLPAPYPAFYKMLILTAQRRDEVAGLQWEELKRDVPEWTLPGTRSKNGEPNVIPLTSDVVSILDSQAGGNKWPRTGVVFRSSVGTPITAFSKGKLLLDAAILKVVHEELTDQAEVDPWRVHDIRRTVATGLQRLGVRFEVTEAVLNHLSGSRSGIAGVYQRYAWGAEKAQALEAWAKHVMQIIKSNMDATAVDEGGHD